MGLLPLLGLSVLRRNLLAFSWWLFSAVTIQALIEREACNRMTKDAMAALNIDPEERGAGQPTTTKIFDRVEPLSTYSIMENGSTVEEFKDP
jgi:hypothetical protein